MRPNMNNLGLSLNSIDLLTISQVEIILSLNIHDLGLLQEFA